MAIRGGVFVGFFCVERRLLPFHPTSAEVGDLQRAIVRSNSPAMYDLFIEAKLPLKVMDVCRECILRHKVELLRHVFPRLDARTAFDLLCEVPQEAISSGAIGILDMYICEMNIIRLDGNAFVVAYAGRSRAVQFEVAWLKKNLLEVVAWLDRLGIQINKNAI